MEEVIEELPLQAVPNQFWGAVKIYTEKPHIINRRICGTVNLWTGVCNEDFCGQNVLKSLIKVLNHDFDKELKKISETPPSINHEENCKCVPVSHSTKDAELTASTFDSNQGEAADCEIDVIQVQRIKKIFYDQGFRSILGENGDSCSEMSACHCKNLDDDGHELFCKCQASRNPNIKNVHLNIPWQHLLESKTLGVAVIRKALPKQLKKFNPVIEVVLIGKV